MRVAVAAVLAGLAAVFVALSWGPLQNLFADYQDGTTWGYLLFGAPFLLLAAGCVYGAIRLVRGR